MLNIFCTIYFCPYVDVARMIVMKHIKTALYQRMRRGELIASKVW